MKNLLISVVAAIAIAVSTLATFGTADAHCYRSCRHNPWRHNQWGYIGLMQGGWGLGGIADAPWVGGSVFAVTSYGPPPYGIFPFNPRP
jgi:hypothetical protein